MRSLRLVVIGDPIAHSLSPVMHRAALTALALPHTYDAVQVSHAHLPAFLDRLRRGEIHGINVTVPHKREALRLCDVRTDAATATAAVNTLWIDPSGRMVGENTDVTGFRADLIAEGIVPRRALVLGAGGAARACVVALGPICASVDIAARRPDAAALLAREVGYARCVSWETMAPRQDEADVGDGYDLIVNATSDGMRTEPAGPTSQVLQAAREGDDVVQAFLRVPRASAAVVYDLVYRPPHGLHQTPLLTCAQARGCRTVNGVGMLVEQGVRALSIFLGLPISPSIKSIMRAAVRDSAQLKSVDEGDPAKNQRRDLPE
ncbi:MAG: shikimate dehydrogenase [Polyangiales bacterium]